MTTPQLPRRIHSRFIAAEITRLRDRANRSADWTADKMGWSPSKQSRIEHGRSPVEGGTLLRLLGLLGASEAEKNAIIDAAMNGDPRDAYQGAVAVLEWGPLVFPGSLQCAAYAWAVEATQAEQITRASPKAAEAAVDVSLRWQRTALDGGGLQIRAVFDESCLTHQYGGTAVMENQMAYMNWIASRPNVTVQMIPLTTAAVPPVSAFTYLQFPSERGPSSADLVLMRQLHGNGRAESSEDAHLYRAAFDELRKLALSEDKTRRAIERARMRWSRRAA